MCSQQKEQWKEANNGREKGRYQCEDKLQRKKSQNSQDYWNKTVSVFTKQSI